MYCNNIAGVRQVVTELAELIMPKSSARVCVFLVVGWLTKFRKATIF